MIRKKEEGNDSMETITKYDFNEIQTWIKRNARPLEYHLWRYHFENGGVEPVLAALEDYQNEDGGFVSAVEPDSWNPNSTPYNTDYAVKTLRQAGFTDINHPLYQGALRYFKHTGHRGEHGWDFTIPSNDYFPHATWWTFSSEDNKFQNIGTTASIVGFILRYVTEDDELRAIALNYGDMLFNKLKNTGDFGDMGFHGYCDLYYDLEAAELGERYDLNFLFTQIKSLMPKALREASWTNHSDMAGLFPKPSLALYKGNEQAVSDALDTLIKIRPTNGVWEIPWNWYDDGMYPKEFAISENWWKSIKAIEKLLFIKSYGRLCL